MLQSRSIGGKNVELGGEMRLAGINDREQVIKAATRARKERKK